MYDSTDWRPDVSDQSKEELNATITTRAEIDRTFARQVIEITTSVMSKNLTHFIALLEIQDTSRRSEHQAVLTAVQETARGLGKLEQRIDDLDARDQRQYQESERDRADLRARMADRVDAIVEQLNDVTRRLAAIEARDAGQP